MALYQKVAIEMHVSGGRQAGLIVFGMMHPRVSIKSFILVDVQENATHTVVRVYEAMSIWLDEDDLGSK